MVVCNITLSRIWTAIETAILTVSMPLLFSIPLSAQTDSAATLATSNQSVRSTAADRHITVGKHTYRIPLDLLRTRLEGTNVDFLQLIIPYDYIGLKLGSPSRPEKYSVENSTQIYLHVAGSYAWVPALIGMDRMVHVWGAYKLEPTEYVGIKLVSYQQRVEAKQDSPLIYYGQFGDESVQISCNNFKPNDGTQTSQCNYDFPFDDLIVTVYFWQNYLPEWTQIHQAIIGRLKAQQEN